MSSLRGQSLVTAPTLEWHRPPQAASFDKPGFATAVIECADGRRVANLASEVQSQVRAQVRRFGANWNPGNLLPNNPYHPDDCRLLVAEAHDPEGFTLIEKLWGISESPPVATQSKP